MIIVVIFVFLLCWSPHVIVSLSVSFGLKISIFVQEVTLLLAKSGVIYNPFIYAVLNHRFRNAFLGMVCQKKEENGALDCSRTPVVSGGLGSSFRISRASISAKTLSERFSEKELDLGSTADQCRLKRICYHKGRINLPNLTEIQYTENETLDKEQEGFEVNKREVQIVQLEQLPIQTSGEKARKIPRKGHSIH